MKLNLGCGHSIMDGWVNVDIVPGPGVDLVANLDTGYLPFPDNSVTDILASHLFEHLRNPLPFMQELHRVAEPGAVAVFRVPYGSSDDAYEDPTHVRQCFIHTFFYFSQPAYWRADYGYRGDWETGNTILRVGSHFKDHPFDLVMRSVMRERNVVKEMIVELIAVKPIREPNQADRQPAKILLEYVEEGES